MDKAMRKSIEKVIEYLWHDEERHWEECGKPRNHIFIHVRRLQKLLDKEAE